MDRNPLEPGTELDGNYRLLAQLGKGGMGEVWEAQHMRLPRRVAIKFLLGTGPGQEEMVARFRREAEIASRLGHPSIVQVFDWNTLADGTPYLVMERLEGEDLRGRLERGPLPLADAREVVRQVASALELTHGEGVVHRDLKPENIFLCTEPDGALRAKVLDFGISKIQGSQTLMTRDDRILGTPGYMAPEQAMGKNSIIDGRTDLFALAAILYEMLSGESIFLGETLAEVVYKVVHHTPAPLSRVTPTIPEGISQAVERALSKDIERRQAGVGDFALAVRGERNAGTQDAAPEATAPPVDPAGATVASEDIPAPAVRVDPEAAVATAGPRATPRRGLLVGVGVSVPVLAAFLAWALWPAPVPRLPVPAMPTGPTPARTRVPQPPARADAEESNSPTPADVRSDAPADARDAATPGPAEQQGGTESARAGKPRAGGRAPGRKREVLPTRVVQKLERAEAALAAGDAAAALRHAKAALYERKAPRVYAVMARAYCHKRDLGMVRAMLRNVGPRERRRVRAYCQEQGLSVPGS